jgi:hypothetical protein
VRAQIQISRHDLNWLITGLGKLEPGQHAANELHRLTKKLLWLREGGDWSGLNPESEAITLSIQTLPDSETERLLSRIEDRLETIAEHTR